MPDTDANPLTPLATFTLRGITKRYVTTGGVPITALDGVDLDIAAGSIVALVGPSGSGKSTLLHVLGGMDTPDSGSVTAGELEVNALSRSDLVAYRRNVGFVFQSFALLPALTALDNVMLPVIPYAAGRRESHRAQRLLADVGLDGREHSLPHQLSGGQQQRVAIARALMNEPLYVLADEPTGNLDSATGAEVVDLIFALRESRGLTVVLATHDEALAHRADVAVHMKDGRIATVNVKAKGP